MDVTLPAELTRNDDGITRACEALEMRFGERLSRGQALREQHGHTMTWLKNQPPDAVVFVQSTQDVADIVAICAEHRCPIIPFGIGSSLEGQLNAPIGGVSIDFTQMNQILEVHAEDLDVVLQPGVIRTQLNEHLRDTGLFFPIDPGAEASLGGMAATRASGTNAVRYGTMRENVISLEAVMPDGRIIRTASRAKKSSSGYDLTRLMVGSEGTLGVITELTIRLHGIPEAVAGAICPFPTVEAACNAVIMTIQYGIPVARIELLDALQVKACNLYSKLDLVEEPMLLLEFHGSDASVKEQSELFGEIAADCGGGDFKWTTDPDERAKLWKARHDAYWSASGLRPGTQIFSTDSCVPISRLAECVEETRLDIEETGLIAPIVGHVGDGNFHVGVLVDDNDRDEIERAEAFAGRQSERAIRMGGTCTGEHGIGQGKMAYMRKEHGDAVDYMRAIKQAIDPQNIMNPGKIIPA